MAVREQSRVVSRLTFVLAAELGGDSCQAYCDVTDDTQFAFPSDDRALVWHLSDATGRWIVAPLVRVLASTRDEHVFHRVRRVANDRLGLDAFDISFRPALHVDQLALGSSASLSRAALPLSDGGMLPGQRERERKKRITLSRRSLIFV